MKTNIKTLKKWIEDAKKLREYTMMFPEEMQEVVVRLASVIEVLAYENIALDEARLELKCKYGNLMRDVYHSDADVKRTQYNW